MSTLHHLMPQPRSRRLQRRQRRQRLLWAVLLGVVLASVAYWLR